MNSKGEKQERCKVVLLTGCLCGGPGNPCAWHATREHREMDCRRCRTIADERSIDCSDLPLYGNPGAGPDGCNCECHTGARP